jgi:hypothetical protein
MKNNSLKVFDIGARYGVHPSWTVLFNKNQNSEGLQCEGLISYFVFDVDSKEI